MPNDTHAALDMLGQEFSHYLSMKTREKLKGYKKQPAAPKKPAEAEPQACEKCKAGDCDIPEHLEDAVAQLGGDHAEVLPGGDDHDFEE